MSMLEVAFINFNLERSRARQPSISPVLSSRKVLRLCTSSDTHVISPRSIFALGLFSWKMLYQRVLLLEEHQIKLVLGYEKVSSKNPFLLDWNGFKAFCLVQYKSVHPHTGSTLPALPPYTAVFWIPLLFSSRAVILGFGGLYYTLFLSNDCMRVLFSSNILRLMSAV